MSRLSLNNCSSIAWVTAFSTLREYHTGGPRVISQYFHWDIWQPWCRALCYQIWSWHIVFGWSFIFTTLQIFIWKDGVGLIQSSQQCCLNSEAKKKDYLLRRQTAGLYWYINLIYCICLIIIYCCKMISPVHPHSHTHTYTHKRIFFSIFFLLKTYHIHTNKYTA